MSNILLDQTIHADTSHLFVHTNLPPHYINLFIPACKRDLPLSRNTKPTLSSPAIEVPATTSTDSETGCAKSEKKPFVESEKQTRLSSLGNGFEIGQTAFVLGSHHLEVSARIMTEAEGQDELVSRLVRPQLQLGDALIFDCRILHFGLGNTALNKHLQSAVGDMNGLEEAQQHSCVQTEGNMCAPPPLLQQQLDDTYWRPMLYVNYHQPWFHDPKNWNDKEKLL
jgi:hypothetical protein